jgi:mannosyl-3-phosphoglycerate phosphatase family protein
MQFIYPRYPLIVYTDLDATLLDALSYTADAAAPALAWLKRLNVPVIPISSKTLAELEVLARRYKLGHPCVAENGALLAFPRDYFPGLDSLPLSHGFHILRCCPDYAEIIGILHGIRAAAGYRFCGFHDMSDAQVAQLAGLDIESAARARLRHSSEPLLWHDSEQSLMEFARELRIHGLQLTEGGRFLHVLGKCDKGTAMQTLNRYYHAAGLTHATTIALGDSLNDLPMLQQADVAVVIRREGGDCLRLGEQASVYYTGATGPGGWNEFMMQYLQQFGRADKYDPARGMGHG